ncbi:MAG: DUF1330 domain-containing protein [Chloroflexi bacterium]|nr:DUF1330 domain-containing protein [Chloroflexota bacterium]
MAVYMILEIEVVDAETYGEYVAQAPATVEQYGGRYLVRGGAITPLTGGWDPQRMVVIEFPTMERFQEWLTSPEYSAIAPLRERSTKSKTIVVEGFED